MPRRRADLIHHKSRTEPTKAQCGATITDTAREAYFNWAFVNCEACRAFKRPDGPPTARFFRKVNKAAPNGCWEWLGARHPDGHGRFWISGETVVYAHRFSYEYYKGQIPTGLILCHDCDNAGCVNPDHLYAGTPKDNAQDAVTRGRMSRKGGRPIDEQVQAKILELHRTGLSGGRISEQVGACIKTVQKYIRQLTQLESEQAK